MKEGLVNKNQSNGYKVLILIAFSEENVNKGYYLNLLKIPLEKKTLTQWYWKKSISKKNSVLLELGSLVANGLSQLNLVLQGK